MSVLANWESLYETALPAAKSSLKSIPGVILGFHSTIDGLKRVEPAQLEEILAADPQLLNEVKCRLGSTPLEIQTPADLLVGLFNSLQRGKALQLMIRNETTANWAMEHLGYDNLRMGGTSGNMANSLAPLPLSRILVYANPLTREQAELFVDEPNLFVINQEGHLQSPRAAWQGEGIYAIHWIFEYPRGLRVKLGDTVLESPRANRFIAAWNPINNKLQLEEKFTRYLPQIASDFSHFIVSGFHILSENYPDGTTWKDYLVPVAQFLRDVKNAQPHLRLHYEFASIASRAIRQGIIDHILPTVDSLGLNEVELCAILRDHNEEKLASEIEGKSSIVAVLQGLERLADRTGLRRIQLHDLGYYLTIVDSGYATAPRTRTGMLFAATLAASRSSLGRVGSWEEIADGLKVPLAEGTSERLTALVRELGTDDLASTGIGSRHGRHVVFIPTRVVARPVLTVGLGDLISSSAFILG